MDDLKQTTILGLQEELDNLQEELDRQFSDQRRLSEDYSSLKEAHIGIKRNYNHMLSVLNGQIQELKEQNQALRNEIAAFQDPDRISKLNLKIANQRTQLQNLQAIINKDGNSKRGQEKAEKKLSKVLIYLYNNNIKLPEHIINHNDHHF